MSAAAVDLERDDALERELARARAMWSEAFADGLRPEVTQTIAEWADEFRILPAVGSSRPGKWHTSLTPYLHEIMEVLTPAHPCRRVVFIAGAQVGKSEGGNNFVGYVIHRAPGPMLMVQPTVDLAKKFSKQRIGPMIEATPVLRERVARSRERDSGNTVLVKEFEGGILIIAGANSAAGLRSMPVRFLFLDEVDRYPGDVEGEGDPVALAEARLSTFESRSKTLLTSTPTVRGTSRIESEFLQSDQRRYFVPCPVCGHMDFITWKGYADFLTRTGAGHHFIHWDEGKPKSAHMVCGKNGCRVEEHHKPEMLARGEWRATAKGDGLTVGYHLPALYAPLGWKSWASCARQFLKAKGDRFKLKTFVQTVLGETWEESGSSVTKDFIRSKCETFPAEVPAGVGVLVAAVDVQGDRLEVLVNGYGEDEESWMCGFSQLEGDPEDTTSKDSVWFKLDRYLAQPFTHESGRKVFIENTVIDSGGELGNAERVYRYCASRLQSGRSVFPIKGTKEQGKPLVGRPSRTNRIGVPLYPLCVDTGKEIVMSRLHMPKRSPDQPGPTAGYIHLPAGVDDEFLEQLTAERALRKLQGGRMVRIWDQVRDRNEAFDLEVYALAALYMLGPALLKDLAMRAAAWNSAPEPEPDPEPPAGGVEWPVPPGGRRTSWVDRWKA